MSEASDLDQDPLDGAGIAGHWEYAYDIDSEDGGGFSSGEFLLRTDGQLLRRAGGSIYGDDGTRWRFDPWEPAGVWPDGIDPQEVIDTLKGRGYSLSQPSPVPYDQRTAGPFPGPPEPARYI